MMKLRSFRLVLGRRGYAAWKPHEDHKLQAAYDKHGPAWTVVSFAVNSRTPVDCRKRYLKLSGVLEGVDARVREDVFQGGYEFGRDGHLIRVPMEQIEKSPMTMLADKLPRRTRRSGPEWSDPEILLVREAFETYGPNWEVIAKLLSKRTPEEVQKLMERQSSELQ